MSAQVPLISVPRKTTSEVDWATPIRQIILAQYGENPDSYNEECSALNRCRQDALRGDAGSDSTTRDLLYKYFGQLELLEHRFPEVRVPFPWSDAFTAKQISQLSIAYEKASVIFNIASTLSSLASSQHRSSAEGFTRAIRFFRSAAGMFSYINDNFLHAPSTDLSRDVVKILVTLMLSQATEVVYEKLVDEKKGAALKSRVASQVAFLYTGIIEEVKEFMAKNVFERAWCTLLQCKTKYYTSLTQYNRSLADSAGGKHGDALARLAIAETNAKEAYRLAQVFTVDFKPASCQTLPPDAASSIVEVTKTHLGLCTEAKTTADKDNDLIYHAPIPSESSLPVVQQANVAEAITIQEVFVTPEVQKIVGQDLFIRLIPLSVHESASKYSEEKARIVRGQGEACDTAEASLKTTLESMGLPGSLSRFRESGGSSALNALADPGPQVKQWSEDVKGEEAQGRVVDAIATLGSLKQDGSADLEAASRDLDNESRECEQARVKYGHEFNQTPSSTAARDLRDEIKINRDALSEASSKDSMIVQMWHEISGDIALLTSPYDSLERAFAETLASSNVDAKPTPMNLLDVDPSEDEKEDMMFRIAAIEEGLDQLQKIKKERQETYTSLREKASLSVSFGVRVPFADVPPKTDQVQSDDISQVLVHNRRSQVVEPALFAAELEKFRGHQNRIAAAIHQQDLCLREIADHFKVLTGGKRAQEIQNQWSNADRKRRDLIARLKRAYDDYLIVKSGLDRGIQFYRDLAEVVRDARRRVTDFVSERTAQRSSIILTLEISRRPDSFANPSSSALRLDSAMNSLNLSSGSRSPPATHPSSRPFASYSSPISPTAPSPFPPPPSTFSPAPQSQKSSFTPYPTPPAAPRSTASYQTPPQPSPFPPPPQPPAGPTRPQHGMSYPYPTPPPPPPSNSQAQSPPPPHGQYSSYGSALPPPPRPFSQSSLPPPSAPVGYSSPYPSQHNIPGQQTSPNQPPPPPLQVQHYGQAQPTQQWHPPPPPPPHQQPQQPPGGAAQYGNAPYSNQQGHFSPPPQQQPPRTYY